MSDPNGPNPARNIKSPSPPNKPNGPSGPKFPNPRESVNPTPSTIREQWRFAVREYAKWYSNAWGTAILAGVSFFALGWYIKGENPLDSFKTSDSADNQEKKTAVAAEGSRSG